MNKRWFSHWNPSLIPGVIYFHSDKKNISDVRFQLDKGINYAIVSTID